MVDLKCNYETVICKKSDDIDLIFSISVDHKMFKNNEAPKYLIVEIFDRCVPFMRIIQDSEKYQYRSYGVFDTHGILFDIDSEINTMYGRIYYIE